MWSSAINILCAIVDANVAAKLAQLQVDPNLLPVIRAAYSHEIAEKLGHLKPNEHEALQIALRAIDEEARVARLYASGKITDTIWDALWEEWQDKRRTLQGNLAGLNQQQESHIANLDTALTIIAKVGILYHNLQRSNQKAVLREMVDKIVVDGAGNIVRLELLPPFAYLKQLADRVKGETNSEDGLRNKNNSISAVVPNCSDCTISGGPEGKRSLY